MLKNRFFQVGWVVNDFAAVKDFFEVTNGIPQFFTMQNLRARDLAGIQDGAPCDFDFNIYAAYSGNTQFELIEPTRGDSIYSRFLQESGGNGIQHLGYLVREDEYEETVAAVAALGYRKMLEMTFSVSRVAYFDTRKDIGVAIEIIGMNADGLEFDKVLRANAF